MKRILFAGPWWHEDLMKGIAHHAAARGWHLNLEPALSGEFPATWQGDGILTTLGGNRHAFERFWKHVACPTVSLSLNYPHIAVPRVGIDNHAAGQLAAEHFLDRGFTSFAFYNRNHQYAGRQRFRVFADALNAAGYQVAQISPPQDHTQDPDQWTIRQQNLHQCLPEMPKPLAVFASDDAGGVEVIEACQTLGLHIPHQVGVLGMLDMPLFRMSTTIPMSSITVDFDTHTRRACEVLESLMKGDPPPPHPILFPPTGIAVRDSTDTIAARVPGVVRAIRFIMDHHADPLDIPDIVRASGLSQTRLYRAFKKDLGRTPNDVLTRVRMEKAQRRLRDTDDKIETIALHCGFGSRINLYRQFKRNLGLSPEAYRRRERPTNIPAR